MCLAGATALTARLGEVTTLEGGVHRGHVRLAAGAIRIIDADAGRIVQVASTNWRGMQFHDSAPASAGAAGGAEPAGLALPWPWRSQDVGQTAPPGGAVRERHGFRLWSSGGGMRGGEDACHFLYKTVRGDSEIVARLHATGRRTGAAQAGVMMRDGLDAGAPNVYWGVSRPGGVFQARRVRGGGTSRVDPAKARVPGWFKLKRLGNTFTALHSRGGIQWHSEGEVTLAMSDTLQVGVAAAGDVPGRAGVAVFGHIREAPSVRLSAFEPRIGLASGSTVVGRIHSADEARLTMAGTLRHPVIGMSKVAFLLFRWLPPALASKVATGRAGVLLTSGDLVDGEFRGLRNDRVTISSVLYGLRSYDVNQEIITVVLRKVRPMRPQYRVRTVGGSVLLGRGVSLGWNEVELDEPALGPWRLPLSELREIERLE